MTLTNFPSGISSMGIPILGSGLGMPVGGKHIFCDPANGSDGNSGLEWTRAFSTLTKALATATAGKNDVIYLIGTGQAAGSARLSETLVWNKDATHLIGVSAPTAVGGRARIAPTSGTTLFTPMVTVSADSCIIANIHMFHGFAAEATAIGCLNVTGERNYFTNCHIAGIGHAEAGDQAASYSLKLTGDGENTFESCTIGLDTIARSTTCSEIEMVSAAVRNTFKDCKIITFADNAGVLFVKIDGAGDIDRWVIFDGCLFTNATNSTATTMTAAMDVNAAAGGHVICKGSWVVGATDWEAADSTIIQLCENGTSVAGDIKAIGLANTVDVA